MGGKYKQVSQIAKVIINLGEAISWGGGEGGEAAALQIVEYYHII